MLSQIKNTHYGTIARHTIVGETLAKSQQEDFLMMKIGNGAMGVCIFGRTDVERIQLAEKTMGNKGAYGMGGFTNFAEIYLDIHHNYAQDYKRALRLNDAISTVNYKHEEIEYDREYFASYPANIIAVKLKASQPGKVSFTLRPVLP